MTATEQVILVDKFDNVIGAAEKLEAHRKNLRHRAFSIFVLRTNPNLQVLLQQRAYDKYHCPLLWTNTCCSHPRPSEDILIAAKRRLQEEMGISLPLINIGNFHYIAHFNNGLVENEIDHVLIGIVDKIEVTINPKEVAAFKWMDIETLKKELILYPENYTPWLGQALELVEAWVNCRVD